MAEGGVVWQAFVRTAADSRTFAPGLNQSFSLLHRLGRP